MGSAWEKRLGILAVSDAAFTTIHNKFGRLEGALLFQAPRKPLILTRPPEGRHGSGSRGEAGGRGFAKRGRG